MATSIGLGDFQGPVIGYDRIAPDVVGDAIKAPCPRRSANFWALQIWPRPPG
jgi:hypothetical protein